MSFSHFFLVLISEGPVHETSEKQPGRRKRGRNRLEGKLSRWVQFGKMHGGPTLSCATRMESRMPRGWMESD